MTFLGLRYRLPVAKSLKATFPFKTFHVRVNGNLESSS